MTERERFGERGRETRRCERTAWVNGWVDFDRWSKSRTPENVYKRCQSNRTINLMKIVNQDLWLGMSSAITKSFAHITLDFTIQFYPFQNVSTKFVKL
jgi:hypothetical protein